MFTLKYLLLSINHLEPLLPFVLMSMANVVSAASAADDDGDCQNLHCNLWKMWNSLIAFGIQYNIWKVAEILSPTPHFNFNNSPAPKYSRIMKSHTHQRQIDISSIVVMLLSSFRITYPHQTPIQKIDNTTVPFLSNVRTQIFMF